MAEEQGRSRDHAPTAGSVTSGQSHTPGPWSVDPHTNNYFAVRSFRTSNQNRAGHVARTTISPLSARREEGLANARLIAAAPELLEALRAAVREQFNGLEDGDALPAWCDAAYAAIACATGGSNAR